jgi:hypothetical protein
VSTVYRVIPVILAYFLCPSGNPINKEFFMRKAIALLTVLFVLAFAAGPAMSGSGPAPSSGDGVSDGSGMDTQNGPNSDNGDSKGPAPNSGDGIPDGSGF